MGRRPFWLVFFIFSSLSHHRSKSLIKAACLNLKLYFIHAVKPYKYITQLFVKAPGLDFTSDTCSFVLLHHGRQISTETLQDILAGKN